MPIIEALVLTVFGLVLPSLDTGSDVAFSISHSFFAKKCPIWEDYVRDQKNGVERSVDENIGKFIDCCG